MKTIVRKNELSNIEYEPEKNAHSVYINKDGKAVPSVTTIIKLVNKPALMNWSNWLGMQGQSYNQYMKKAAYIGTCVHEIIECKLLGKKFELKEPHTWFLEVPTYIENFLAWYEDNEIIPIKIEEKMVTDRFGGTCDLYCEFDGKKTILDIKTSKSVYSTMFIQLAGYVILKELQGESVEQVGILTVNKKEAYVTLMTRDELDIYIDTFHKLVDSFHGIYQLTEIHGWQKIV